MNNGSLSLRREPSRWRAALPQQAAEPGRLPRVPGHGSPSTGCRRGMHTQPAKAVSLPSRRERAVARETGCAKGQHASH